MAKASSKEHLQLFLRSPNSLLNIGVRFSGLLLLIFLPESLKKESLNPVSHLPPSSCPAAGGAVGLGISGSVGSSLSPLDSSWKPPWPAELGLCQLAQTSFYLIHFRRVLQRFFFSFSSFFFFSITKQCVNNSIVTAGVHESFGLSATGHTHLLLPTGMFPG